jgi:hypothetical protein
MGNGARSDKAKRRQNGGLLAEDDYDYDCDYD